MMNKPTWKLLGTSAALLSTLFAAGCSSSDTLGQFTSSYTATVASLGSASGLTAAAQSDLFDADFKDSSVTKADALAALAGEAAVQGTTDGFTQVTLSNVVISNCGTALTGDTSACLLTATVTNADADSVAVTMTTLVRGGAGAVRLFGDQAASANP